MDLWQQGCLAIIKYLPVNGEETTAGLALGSNQLQAGGALLL